MSIIITSEWNQQHGSTSINNNIQRWPFEPAEENRMFPEKSVIYFGLDVACLLQNAAMAAKKLLVDDNITACFKQTCCYMLSSGEKNIIWWNILLSSKRLLSIFKFRASSNLSFFFTSCWLAHNQISWNVLLFSCNPIGY